MELGQQTGYLLHHVAFALDRQADKLLFEQLGLGFSQFKILMAVQSNPNVQQKQIADKLGQTEASISRQVKLMHDRGLLRTRINSTNRREHITTLTVKGNQLADKAMAVLNSHLSPVFSRLSNKDQAKFLEMLQSLHIEICRDDKPGRCH